jgi:AcrR family transcriptional regulator
MKNKENTFKDFEKEFFDPSFKYLVENGFENTSVRDLCRAMNLSPGSVYYWFEDKEDIYINTVRYGTGKVASKLFEFAVEKMQDPKLFFDTFLQEVDKYKKEFRFIFQVTASPLYGNRIRSNSEGFKFEYEKYISRLAQTLKCSKKDITPIIYMLISILVDYVLWEDYEVSKMQTEFLYGIVKQKFIDPSLDIDAVL